MKKKIVAPGIYLREDGKYSYRPWVRGKRTERILKATTPRAAMKEVAALSEDKDEECVEELAKVYLEAGAPDKQGRPRPEHFIEHERKRLKNLLPFFGQCMASEVNIKSCVDYKQWRCRRVKRGKGGERSTDLELNTLSNVLNYAVLSELVDANKIANGRPRFRTKGMVTHCRERCPRSGDELHRIAAYLADGYAGRAVPLAFQALFEAIAGTRTIETVPLRWDAEPGQPGAIRDGKWLYIARAKQRENEPYDCIPITEPLRWLLLAMRAWRAVNYPESPWFFPSWQSIGKEPVHKTSITHALQRAAKAVLGKDRQITSHGCRAFFVTWKRVTGMADTQIAEAVGHYSGGAALIWAVYGKRLPAWAAEDFRPEPKEMEPLWARFLPWVGRMPPSEKAQKRESAGRKLVDAKSLGGLESCVSACGSGAPART